MENELVKFKGGSLPVNADALQRGLQNVGANIQATGGIPLLRLIKSGEWVHGPENLVMDEGSEWAINPLTLQHGYACWGDSVLLGEAMVALDQSAPNLKDLKDFGYDWAPQYSVQVQCLDGQDEGLSALYKGTSKGQASAMKLLIQQILARLAKHPESYIPIVVFGIDSYTHKKHGLTYTPILDVVRWVSLEGDEGEEDPEALEDQHDVNEDDSEYEIDDEAELEAEEERIALEAANRLAPEDQTPPDDPPTKRRRRGATRAVTTARKKTSKARRAAGEPATQRRTVGKPAAKRGTSETAGRRKAGDAKGTTNRRRRSS